VQAKQFSIVYHSRLKEHLRSIDRKYHSLIRENIETQLRFEPDVKTRNRKLLRGSPIFEASWEIRFGPENRFRVFYDVVRSRYEVDIVAIGEKDGNRLLIGGEEINA